ncbi:MAG: hypothetical protein NTZ05_04130, partial [Chloroflexi bacterium]|nr:hypothetical protein [Chloroflexota bacterium]
MAPIKTGTRHEIILGEVRYPIIEPVRTSLQVSWPDKQVIGEPGPDDEPLLSNWVISDSRGGLGVDLLDLQDKRHAGRFWWSTAWTLTKNMITLPPYAQSCGNPGTADPVLTWEYKNAQYAVFGAKVYKWLEGSGTWSSSLHTLPNAPIDAVVYVKTVAVAVLVIACGTALVTFDGTTWTDHTNTGSWLANWDDKVWKIDSVGQLKYSVDPAANAWTTDAVLRLHEDDSATGLLVGPEPETKSPVIYVTTTSGLWIHDASGPKLNPTGFVAPGQSTGGQGSARWRAMLYYNSRDLGVYQFNPVDGATPTVTPMGLDLDDGLPSDIKGVLVKLESTHNWLLALVDGGRGAVLVSTGTEPTWDSETFPVTMGYTSLMAWNGVGWHCIWRSAASVAGGRVLSVSQAYGDYRVWFSAGKTVYYIRLNPAVENPRHSSTKTFTDQAVEYITPAFGAGTTQDKLAVALKVNTEGCSATETVVIYVDYDLSDSWALFGAISSNGLHSFTFQTNDTFMDGKVYNFIRFKFVLSRGSNNTTRPVVTYVVAPFLKLLDRVMAFEVTVDCTKSYKDLSAKQLRLALMQAAKSQVLLRFTFQDAGLDLQT